MFKNLTGQTVTLVAYDSATGKKKTGDASNITFYYNLDNAGVTIFSTSSGHPTEDDATNSPGTYTLAVTTGETNANKIVFSGKSSTSGIEIVPLLVYTFPTTGILAPTTAGRTLDVSSTGEAGLDWANVGSPTTTLALTGTTIADTQKCDVNTIKTQTVTCSAGVTVNVNVGTTQPVNFTGTAGSALVKSDMVDIAGAAVSTSTAQLGVNVVNFGGSAGTFASGRPEVNTTHIAGTLSAGVAGYMGVDWSHVNAPTTTLALTGTTISTNQQVASTAVCGSLIANADKTGYFLDSTVITSIWTLANAIETGVTPAKALQRIGAVAAGKISGAGTGTEVFLGLDGATTRVTVTVDSSGNRTAVVYA